MAARIHPTAIVDPQARLAADVTIGPYTIVGADVEIGAATRIGSHVVIGEHTRIGARNTIFQFCSIGEAPQDKKYDGEPTRLEIGDDNTIREFCTLNRGTIQDAGVTRVGNHNWIMAYVHLAHDCQIGNHTIFANNAQLAGHVHIGDYVVLGGFTGVHQFCRVGAHCMTAIGAVVLQDVPPFVMAAGNTAEPRGINAEGLKRRGYSTDAIAAIRRAFKTLYKSGLSFDEARAQIAVDAATQPALQPLVEFLATPGRGVIR